MRAEICPVPEEGLGAGGAAGGNCWDVRAAWRQRGRSRAAILEDLAAEERWEAALSADPAALERLADEALAEHRAGRTKPRPRSAVSSKTTARALRDLAACGDPTRSPQP